MARMHICTLALLAATACGNDGSGNGGAGPSDPATGCEQFYTQVLAYLATCPGGKELEEFLSPGLVKHDCDTPAADVKAGVVKYDGSKIAPCVAALMANGCSLAAGPPSAACNEIFVGTVAAGGPCKTNTECADGGACDFLVSSGGVLACPGMCVAKTAEGQPCQSASDCRQGLVCPSGTCTSQASPVGGPCKDGEDCVVTAFCQQGTCAARPSSGQPCGSAGECASGLVCVGGACARPTATGGACRASQECLSGVCASGTCADLELSMAGGPCGLQGSTAYGCLDSWCDVAAGSMMGTCRAQLAVGAACDPTKPFQCTVGSTCIQDVCTASSCF